MAKVEIPEINHYKLRNHPYANVEDISMYIDELTNFNRFDDKTAEILIDYLISQNLKKIDSHKPGWYSFLCNINKMFLCEYRSIKPSMQKGDLYTMNDIIDFVKRFSHASNFHELLKFIILQNEYVPPILNKEFNMGFISISDRGIKHRLFKSVGAYDIADAIQMMDKTIWCSSHNICAGGMEMRLSYNMYKNRMPPYEMFNKLELLYLDAINIQVPGREIKLPMEPIIAVEIVEPIIKPTVNKMQRRKELIAELMALED